MMSRCGLLHHHHLKPCSKVPDHPGEHQAYVGGIGLVTWTTNYELKEAA